MDYLQELKDSMTVSRVKQPNGAIDVSGMQYTLEDLAWGCKAAILELNDDDPVLCEQIKYCAYEDAIGLVFESTAGILLEGKLDGLSIKQLKNQLATYIRERDAAKKKIADFKSYIASPEKLDPEKREKLLKRYRWRLETAQEDLKEYEKFASQVETQIEKVKKVATTASTSEDVKGTFTSLFDKKRKLSDKIKSLESGIKKDNFEAADSGVLGAERYAASAKKKEAELKKLKKELEPLQKKVTAARHAYDETKKKVPQGITVKNVSGKQPASSPWNIQQFVEDPKKSPISNKLHADVKQSTDKINKTAKDAIESGAKEVGKKAKDISAKAKTKMSTGKKVGIALTVAAVTALAYAAYKKYKNKKKSQAALAAAQQSSQLERQAKKQGKDKAAKQAAENAKKWKTRAKKYKAQGQ
jgi:uncharacterized membrane protein YukC